MFTSCCGCCPWSAKLPLVPAADSFGPAGSLSRIRTNLWRNRRPPTLLSAKLNRLSTRTPSQVATRVATELAERGFTLGQLLQFVKSNGLEDRNLSTAEVVRDIIIPHTADRRCNYAEIMPAFSGPALDSSSVSIPSGPKTPLVLVSHSWSTSFMNTVKAITQFAAGKESLDAKDYSEIQLRLTFWLCIFAVNQHTAICGTSRNPCSCGSEKFLPPHPQAEIDKFEDVMHNIRSHMVAMDLSLSVLKRVWVLAEIGVAIKLGKKTLFLGSLPEDLVLHGSAHVPLVQDGEASDERDKDRILHEIEVDIGFDKFNRRVREKFDMELKTFRMFRLLEQRDFETMIRLVESDPILLHVNDIRHNDDTLLHSLVRQSTVADFVVRALELKADPNILNSSGETPLQTLAASQGCPLEHELIMQSLLEAGADVGDGSLQERRGSPSVVQNRLSCARSPLLFGRDGTVGRMGTSFT